MKSNPNQRYTKVAIVCTIHTLYLVLMAGEPLSMVAMWPADATDEVTACGDGTETKTYKQCKWRKFAAAACDT